MNSLTLCGMLLGFAVISADVSATRGRTVSKEVTVRATPEQVWSAWTTVEGLTAFFAREADVDLRIGGKYELFFDPYAPEGQRGSEDCKVLTFIPNQLLSFSWNAPPSIPNLRNAGVKTHVVVYIDDVGEGRIRVRIRHMGIGEGDDWDKYHAYFDRAWDSVLKKLSENIGKIAVSSSAPTAGRVLIHEASVEAPLERVWNAFTNRDNIADWMVPLVEMDLRIGGTMKTNYHADGRIGDPSTIVHRIDSLDYGHMLAMHVEKFPVGFPHGETILRCWGVLRFDEVSPQRTKVRIYGLGYGNDEGSRKAMAFYDKGNAWELEQLRKYLASKPVDQTP